MSFTRVVQETFGGEPSSTGSTASSDESMSSRVIIGLQLNRSTWDKAVGALGVAAAVGSFIYLKGAFSRWRHRVRQDYQHKEEARLRCKRNAVAADVFHAARYPEDARVELDLHRAECHCGRIKITVRAPVHLRAVDCSTAMSTKKGRFPYIFVDAADFRLDCGGDFLTVYTHGTHTAKHMFCSGCGVHVFNFPRGSAEAGGIAVNVHTLDREHVESLHVAFVPGDHLMQDFEPTVPSIPTSPSTRRARVENSMNNNVNHLNRVVEQQQQMSPNNPQYSSNPQASSNTSSPRSNPATSPPQQQQQQQQQQHSLPQRPPQPQSPQFEFVNPFQLYTGVPSLTQLLAPGLPRPVGNCTSYGALGGLVPVATEIPNPGQRLAGVNFFRKQAQRTPAKQSMQPTIMQTLVHGGGAAAYAIGRAAGVLTPENTSNRSNGSPSHGTSNNRYRTQAIQAITPVRIDQSDPMYNTRVRNTERKKMESMNSVVSIKNQLQRYLGAHKTPQKSPYRQTESGFYN